MTAERREDREPQVNVAVVGRFHAFDLARELDAHGMLNKLQTTYPRGLTRRWGFAADKTINEPDLEAVMRVNRKLGLVAPWRVDAMVQRAFARRSARRMIGDADVFVGWTGCSLEAFLAARDAGMITILERGNSHPSLQRELMTEECARIGKSYPLKPLNWQRELLEFELADYVSVASRFVAESLIARGVGRDKILLNPYGVDLSAFHQAEREDDVFRIINVGAFSLRKGSRYLLQAFRELDLPDAELWHVGSVEPEMRPFIEEYRSDKVVFHGHKPQAELYRYYSQATVFVLASIEEGLAMVQPQAMACGLPIICTTNTGGADLIGPDGDAGYVVPIRDVEALKDRILRLYENRAMARDMGQRAKARVANGLTWADYGARYAKNIREIAGAGRGQVK